MKDKRPDIPVYGLYGEHGRDVFDDRLHWETLVSRSQLHDFRIAPHRHEQLFQILRLTGGVAEVALDGRTMRLAPPALIVVPALTVHGYVFSEDIEGVVLTLYQRDIRAMLDERPETAGMLREAMVLTDPAPIAAIGRDFDALIAEAQGRGPGHGLALQARFELLLAGLVHTCASMANQGTADGGRALQHAQRFQALVDREFRARHPIGYYASALGMTPPHLNRICREILGVSALAVIERRLMLEAKRYLMFTAMSGKQVALALGYADPAYFSRAFRRHTGVPPGRFRAEHGDWTPQPAAE